MRSFLFAALFAVLTGVSSSAFALNPIVTENQQTVGVAPQSEWDLAEIGSSAIEGYATDISVNHGSTINFKIKTSATSWKIDIYRLGYYQGNGARLLHTINMSGPALQPLPIVQAATGLVDAGNWSVTTSWSVPSTAVSGVYIARLVNNANPSQANHITFIVRADESTSDIVFQTSDTTWQAYNGWPCDSTAPSNNLYGGSGPGTDGTGRAYKVSYNRPIATRDNCGVASSWTDFLFGAEYAAIFWLEQNGYDVSYIAGADTARFPAHLLQHKTFASIGHDEYWDTNARSNVESALAAGVNLAFFSGNEVFWKTRWEQSIAGAATSYRTLVCYKETRHNAPLDPLDAAPTWTWTGTWRDPRNSPPADGGKPENALTGTLYQVDSYRADAITVPHAMSILRFWRNTPHVAQTPVNGTTTLTQNILGYEWDESPDNTHRPPGLINLSSTTLTVAERLLNYGSIDGDGVATHHLTMHRHPTSHALVFGAGTVFWSWGLSSNHDGPPTPVDVDIQQATVNVLADMGVQPETLQAGLVPATKSTDISPPTSSIASPANGANFVEGQPVTVAGSANDVGGVVAGVEVSVDGGAYFRATGTTNWTYTWIATPGVHTIVARATDDSVNSGATTEPLTINVASSGSKMFGVTNVTSASTAEDRNAVELGVKFAPSVSGSIRGVRFFKDWINVGDHTASLWGPSGNLLATTAFTHESPRGWQTVLFSSPIPVTAGTTYTASYHTKGYYSATSAYFTTPMTIGNFVTPVNAGVYQYGVGSTFPSSSYQAANYWVDVLFEPTPTTNPPTIQSPLAANGTVGAPFNYQITATNSPTSYNATGLPPGLTINTATGAISGAPTAASTYNVLLSATNAIGVGTATLVLTIAPAVSTYSSLFSTSDAPAIVTVNDSSAVELGVRFVAASAGSIAGMRFYKGPQNIGTHTGYLWSASGTLLASATFSDETASGWQTVLFSAPVPITAGATYTASYHSNGYYSATGAFFAAPYVNGVLSAPSGSNGVYAYGSAGTFPSNSYNATNYWVDVLFEPTPTTNPPTIQSPLAASGTVGAPFSYQITATNSPTSYNATGLPPGLTINTTTGTISGTPTAANTYSVQLGATNAIGVGTATLVLTIAPAVSTYSSLFSTSDAPVIVTVNDNNSVELGVRFVAASAGSIAGMRFYKGPQNIGTHTGYLWSAAGALLASATFSDETASGWQTVLFSAPVPITAGATYTASYHSNGYYSATGAFFAAPYVNGVLSAPSGSNGVYAYGSAGTFPSNSYNATNYWVDVLFQ